MIPVRRYSLERTFVPLLCSSECFILIYEELPRPLIRLFNLRGEQIQSLYLRDSLVDMCYAEDLQSFVLLAEKSLDELNPSIGHVESLSDYQLLKENRSMSSICSVENEGLVILYRFGEYLDKYPHEKRIWKRRHLCQSLNEEIFLVRSSTSTTGQKLLGLFIVEWNDIWRVDIFSSSSLERLHTGFRFSSWTRSCWSSQWSTEDQCWSVPFQRLNIDQRGQPKKNSLSEQEEDECFNLVAMKKIIVTRDERSLNFFSREK